MKRRQFITLIGGAAAAWPLAARGQQSSNKIPVVGVLWHAGSAEEESVYLSVLVKAFNDLGYVEGKNIHLDQRYPAENPERFRILARELVDEKPDVIIAVTVLGAVNLKKLTDTIPIVFVLSADPIGFGLVESLAAPGGNATGLSLMSLDLSGKRLSLLKEAVPNLSRVALLVDPTDTSRNARSKPIRLQPRRWEFRCGPQLYRRLMISNRCLPKWPRKAPMESCVRLVQCCSFTGRARVQRPSHIGCH
jgi:putative tryptophan/tyrosine transport system substrate-binding protein